jgi:hypothetical protein
VTMTTITTGSAIRNAMVAVGVKGTKAETSSLEVIATAPVDAESPGPFRIRSNVCTFHCECSAS